ncbi:RNA exonuclease Rex2 [Ceratobasidium theobromae]|uniref:RNA exonuclease Rex2 n=1 Tax=Ceratobasidium theobromae TaxID=1582974 RepID=A0A5N5QIL1_9AGAM|nr:RNA exonuclease Rex2 [Ceratobasidium theobromae]
MNVLGFRDGPLVWIDCEMTGLDPEVDRIIEIAVLITNGNLDLVDETGCHYVVKTSKEVLDNISVWENGAEFNMARQVIYDVTRRYTILMLGHLEQSGLTQEAINSPYPPEEVATRVLEYIRRWVPAPHTGTLAGNSVHADAMFLQAKGPDAGEGASRGVWNGVMEHLYYRLVGMCTQRYATDDLMTP